MHELRLTVAIFSVGLMAFNAGAASLDGYPNKPIRVVTAEPGGGTDVVARVIVQPISTALGQQMVVDNRPSGVIPGDIVAKAPPDGYTLLIAGGLLWIGPLLEKTPYDAIRDFAPITLAVSTPNVMVVHPALPVKSVAELIALAKAKPGVLNYASGGTGSSNHLAAILFNSMAGISIVRIPYKGTAPAVIALIAGEVQLMFSTAGSVVPHVKAGRLRALGISSARPWTALPDLPTIAASGLPGYESGSTLGVFAPAKTPAAIIKRLNQEMVRVASQPDVKQKFAALGVETVGNSPEEYAAYIKSDFARLGKVIKETGIKAE